MGYLVAAALLCLGTSAGLVIQQPQPNVLDLRDTTTIPLSAEGFIPSNASPVVDPSFPGLAFEETSFPLYAGNPGNPNTFSVNLLNDIAKRTAVRGVSIRVGGTSLDDARYVASQQEAVQFPSGQVGNVPSGVTLGPTYFDSFRNFPSAQYVLCIPLASNNLSNAVEFVSEGYPKLKSQLDQLEIGNEPQGYHGGRRLAGYTVQDYINQSVQYTNAINTALGFSSTTPIYEGIALGSPAQYETSNVPAKPGAYYPNNIFPAGLSVLAPNFKSVSLHYYQTRARTDIDPTQQLRNQLLNHTLMVSKMTFFQPAVQYLAQNYPSIRVNLAEAASSLNGAQNDYGLESTFGAALWQVDWMLWCMTIGIHRINWQQIAASAFDLWQPVTYKGRNPAVLPPYYAMLFAADFIGTSGDTRVVNIDLDSDVYAAYGAYSSARSRLVRLALVNLDYFVGTTSQSNHRPAQSFNVPVPFGVTSVRVDRLSAPTGATANSGAQMTWQGYQWTAASKGQARKVQSDTTTLLVVNRQVTVTVAAQEAIMLTMNYGF